MAKLADHEIIPAVLAKIEHCDAAAKWYLQNSQLPFPWEYADRFAKAADRLRDFATVELLCEGLGITRKEIE